MNYYTGNIKPNKDTIFVFGSNPEGRTSINTYMNTILINETKEKFGYDPTRLSTYSEKMVICRCPVCNTIREKKFRCSGQMCAKCSNKINSVNSANKRSKKLKKFFETHTHNRLGKHHTEESKQKIKDKRKKQIFSDDTRKKISIAVTGEKNGFYGKHHREESKRYGKDNHMYGKTPPHAKKCWYKDVCFRSTWEVKTAKYFDDNKIKWTYETDVIEVKYIIDGKEKIATYRPDFFLVDYKKYIEVKGLWRKGYKEKFIEAQKISKYPIELWDKTILKQMGIVK